MEDLTTEQWSYIIGLLHGDGYMGGGPDGPGRMAVSVSQKDADIIETLEQMLLFKCCIYSTEHQCPDQICGRDVGIEVAYRSTLVVHGQEARLVLLTLGMPYGPKSFTVSPPGWDYSRRDYLRGIIDADGSLGFTKTGIPFLSLATGSDAIKDEFVGFIEDLTGVKKKLNRNKRDGIYNICVYREDAQKLIAEMYYDGAVALKRKRDAATAAAGWERPAGCKKAYHIQRWEEHEDPIVLGETPTEAARILGRKVSSVYARRRYLRRGSDAK